ncbi:hypothetical protein BIY27_24995 [Gibbsiella quercinecans]|nr:hypothetical protein BIY27_24995 [Gibbsiella quercinecans]
MVLLLCGDLMDAQERLGITSTIRWKLDIGNQKKPKLHLIGLLSMNRLINEETMGKERTSVKGNLPA